MPIKSRVMSKRCFGMKFWQYIVIAAFLFVCMYDPKSGGLENYLTPGGGSRVASSGKPCCDEAPIGRQCNSPHYQSVQFAEPGMGCPRESPKSKDGAIFGR
jgi:hypothetical protein